MKAIFPSTCSSCSNPIAPGDEIVDSGRRGPRGGKKMVHVGCAARQNSGVAWTRAFNNPAKKDDKKVGLQPKFRLGVPRDQDPIVRCRQCGRLTRDSSLIGRGCFKCVGEDLPARPNPDYGYKRPVKAFEIVWAHTRGKQGEYLGMPGAESETVYRYYDLARGHWEPAAVAEEEARAVVRQLRRLGVRDIMIFDARGNEVALTNPQGKKNSASRRQWRYTIRYTDPHHSAAQKYDSFLTVKEPRQWLRETEDNEEYQENFVQRGDVYTTSYTDGTGRTWYISIEPVAGPAWRLNPRGKKNPIPRPGGMAIPGEWPDWAYQYGPDPQVANWLTYPQYSYEQFYRTNPRSRHNPLYEAHYLPMPQNAGPYLPEMFPYGAGGRPADYVEAKKNPRTQLGVWREQEAPPSSGYTTVAAEYSNPYGEKVWLTQSVSGPRAAWRLIARTQFYDRQGLRVLDDLSWPPVPADFYDEAQPYWDGKLVGEGGNALGEFASRRAAEAALCKHETMIEILTNGSAGGQYLAAARPFTARTRNNHYLHAAPATNRRTRVRVGSGDATDNELILPVPYGEFILRLTAWQSGDHRVQDAFPNLSAEQREFLINGRIEADLPWHPGTTAEANPRTSRGPRGGYSEFERDSLPKSAFLKPSTRSWPVSDRRHAEIAIQYMTRGFGNRAEYPKLIRRLAKHYPVEESMNRSIWTFYRQSLPAIERISGSAMPTVAELRKREAKSNRRR